ncbi:hypothetical protein Bca4012_078051 [Brassica carinata]
MMSQSDNFQSVNSQSAISSSSTVHRVLCDCNRKAKIERAWTCENPGRRFFGCKGRQHLALLAARDIIREQKEELAVLRNKVLGERSAVFRNVLVASSVGFAIILGEMIVMSKY